MIYRSIDINWTGQSGFKIKTGSNKIIYIDPFRLHDFSEKADVIFLTHSHYDHCSIEDIQGIVKNGTIIIAPADVSSKMRHISVKIDLRVAEIGSKQTIFDSLKFWAIPAYNIKNEGHEKEDDWVGYIIDMDGVLIYHAGDTDLIPEMKSLSNPKIDIALLPIGGTFTMNAGEAAKAALLIKPIFVVPMHYDTVSGVGTRGDADIFLKLCSQDGIAVKIFDKS